MSNFNHLTSCSARLRVASPSLHFNFANTALRLPGEEMRDGTGKEGGRRGKEEG